MSDKRKVKRRVELDLSDEEKDDISTIKTLKESIENMLSNIRTFEEKPEIDKNSIVAAKALKDFSMKVLELNKFLNDIEPKISKSQDPFWYKDTIKLLQQKEQAVQKVNELIPSLKDGPPVLDIETYKTTYEKSRTRINEMKKKYREHRQKINNTEIGLKILENFEAKSKVIYPEIETDLSTVNRVLKRTPNTVNADQSATLTKAENNLDILEKQFNQLFDTLDAKMEREHKIQEVQIQIDELSVIFNILFALRSINNDSSLYQSLDEILTEKPNNTFKASFNKKKYLPTVEGPLTFNEELSAKAAEIGALHKKMDEAIKTHLSKFASSKADIEYLLKHNLIFYALGQGDKIDYSRLNQAIQLNLQGNYRDNANTIYNLILHEHKIKALEKQKILASTLISQFRQEFPEIPIESDRHISKFKYNEKEYPLSLEDTPFVYVYRTARAKIEEAIEQGDQRYVKKGGRIEFVDYGELYNNLKDAKKSLEQFVRNYAQMEQQKKKIEDLVHITELRLKTSPKDKIDTSFDMEYADIQSRLNKIKRELSIENRSSTALSIMECRLKLDQLITLHDAIKSSLNQLKETKSIYNNMLEQISTAKGIISDRMDPRIELLGQLELSIQDKIRTTDNLETELLTNIAKPNVKIDDIKQISSKIQMEANKTIANIESLINDERLEQLSLATRHPFVAWLIKLCRPLVAYINKGEVAQKPGFFASETEISLKKARDNITQKASKELEADQSTQQSKKPQR